MAQNLSQDLQETRQRLFEFFSAFFIGPRNEELLKNRKAVFECVLQIAEALEIESPTLQISEEEPDPLALETQFARLFYGVGQSTVSMQERAYRGEDFSANRESIVSLLELFASAGLQLDKNHIDDADSLGMELAFAATLLSGNQDTQSTERTLLNQHLFPLARCIRDQAKALEPSGPVIEVLDALVLFLESEIKLLKPAT